MEVFPNRFCRYAFQKDNTNLEFAGKLQAFKKTSSLLVLGILAQLAPSTNFLQKENCFLTHNSFSSFDKMSVLFLRISLYCLYLVDKALAVFFVISLF